MGWYGIFLVRNLKLIFSLRKIDEENLYSYFEDFDKFFSKYDQLREDIDYMQNISEESKTFSAKTTSKMFNVVDELSFLPDVSNAVFLLYFLHKFEIEYHYEGGIDFEKLRKKGWKTVV
ncbi:MAG: hypothetical protein AABX29_02365 [Nanoarchaeota archaeon]